MNLENSKDLTTDLNMTTQMEKSISIALKEDYDQIIVEPPEDEDSYRFKRELTTTTNVEETVTDDMSITMSNDDEINSNNVENNKFYSNSKNPYAQFISITNSPPKSSTSTSNVAEFNPSQIDYSQYPKVIPFCYELNGNLIYTNKFTQFIPPQDIWNSEHLKSYPHHNTNFYWRKK